MKERIRVYIGGLMRCCTGTLSEYDGPETDGTELDCKWCGNPMIVRDRHWHWNKDKAFARAAEKQSGDRK